MTLSPEAPKLTFSNFFFMPMRFPALFPHLSKSHSEISKENFTLEAENHLDRQSVVDFFPLGSDSAPFGSNLSFWALVGGVQKNQEVSFWDSGLRTIEIHIIFE